MTDLDIVIGSLVLTCVSLMVNNIYINRRLDILEEIVGIEDEDD